ncbi:hypothetical protein BMW23_0844 [Bodo saltans virus]|uniref:Transmembrane protein n=1 Tax=Bodo saltans virus TaxID=2024608 RepID=A0A2H4UVE5_9VIRU|nr:hypothetical protein QJ851_gp0827 [Bodo saltans virus]ATZ80890.1 hypothetical protein BMW23_0844 [Bodo saltans virus]
MFYTLISRLPFITNDNSDTKLLKIFVLGSVIYILVHYYLFSQDRGDMLNIVKPYLYYAMAADLGIAYALTKLFGSSDESPQIGDGYSQEQLQEIQQQQMQLMRAKVYQDEIAKRQAVEQNNKNNENDNDDEEYSNKSPFKKKENKNNTSSSSSDSSSKQKNIKKEKEKQQKQKDDTDTHIPIYNDE